MGNKHFQQESHNDGHFHRASSNDSFFQQAGSRHQQPDKDDKRFQQAYSKHMAGNKSSARMLYERILKQNPRHVDARYMLGTLLAESGVLELGLMHLKSAATQMRSSPMILTNLGHVHLKLGQLDQARSCYQNALKLDPNAPQTLFNLGDISQRQGNLAEAVNYIEQSLDLKPDFLAAYFKLGRIHRELNHPELSAACFMKLLEYAPDSIDALFELGNIYAAYQHLENAAIYFKRILEIDPDNESARHAVSALSGETTATAPLHHVEHLFDELSGSFESHLKQLGYRVPEMLKRMVLALESDRVHFDRAVDMGCGTGLSGVEFKPMVTHLTGLDISQKMLDRAREKGIYDELEKSDICQYLASSQQHYDIFIATDVFVYLGDLSSVFSAVSDLARQNSYFVFSTEGESERDYILRPTGRYAHSRSYIEKLANEHGFSLVASQSTDLRMEGQKPVKGDLYALKFNISG